MCPREGPALRISTPPALSHFSSRFRKPGCGDLSPWTLKDDSRPFDQTLAHSMCLQEDALQVTDIYDTLTLSKVDSFPFLCEPSPISWKVWHPKSKNEVMSKLRETFSSRCQASELRLWCETPGFYPTFVPQHSHLPASLWIRLSQSLFPLWLCLLFLVDPWLIWRYITNTQINEL